MRSSHIIELQENNLGGKDYILADVHGDAASFTAVLGRLTPNDRLFSVGDLIDRGAESADIIPLVMMYQKAYPNRLYVTRGNHEDMFLKTIQFLEDRIDDFDAIPYSPENTAELNTWLQNILNTKSDFQDIKCFQGHMHSGGKWLVRLFKDELHNGDITALPPEEFEDDSSSDEEAAEVIYQDTSKIHRIHQFITALPYIIFVDGEKPFTVSHADQPFNLQTLKFKLTNNINLTEAEIRYVMNAREKSKAGQNRILIKQNHQEPNPVLSYNGHNIVLQGDASVVRHENNAVNTDVASFKTHVALLVNHTDGTCEYVGMNVEQALQEYPQLKDIQAELAAHLRSVMLKQVQTMLDQENLAAHILPSSSSIDRLKSKFRDKPEPLSPSKKGNLNSLKRERQEDGSEGKPSPAKEGQHPFTPNNSPMKSSATLFHPDGRIAKRSLFSSEESEAALEKKGV